jgi:hypothetical protein
MSDFSLETRHMPLTLNQAAHFTGKSKNTVLRAIASGKLSERRNENGTYAFDEAELAKVFPPTGPDAEILEVEIEGLRALVEELRMSRDDWKARALQAERLMEALILKATPK